MAQVTICLPTYEPHSPHLREALDSVLEQTFQDWALIIHDDASTIDTESIVRPYLKDPRIRFIKSPRRLGIGGNWNACIKLSTAPIIQFLFQDDMWKPEYLRRALHLLDTQESIGFVATHHRYSFDGPIENERKETYLALERLRQDRLVAGKNDGTAFLQYWIERGLRPNIIGEPSFVMIRRALLDRIGLFREDLPQGLDMEMWLRCVLESDVGFIAENGGEFRVHSAGASARNDAEGKGLFDRLACFEMLLHRLPAGETRRKTATALSKQFAEMIRKFFGRRSKGGHVSSSGANAMFRLMLRHPMVVLRGFWKFLFKKAY